MEGRHLDSSGMECRLENPDMRMTACQRWRDTKFTTRLIYRVQCVDCKESDLFARISNAIKRRRIG